MQRKNRVRAFVVILGIFILAASSSIYAQPLKTPLDQKILDILSNEISGQTVYNNEVFLAGAPWLRTPEEFTGTFYESEKIYEMAQRYGITTTRLERTDAEGSFEYPVNGEFWIEKPDKRLIAKLEADPALIARGSKSVELTADLVYIPPLSKERIDSLRSGNVKPYEGKVALMWSHVRGNEAAALDSAGLRGVVSFNTRERYFDPGQVVYSRGSYGRGKSLDFGLSVSWRQWSELLEDVESGKPIVVRCKTQIEMFPDKYETVFSWIEGSEPDAKGVVFVAHLFEGYTKRGANDNMSGCVVQLEILRALTKLIREGTIPQPRRNIYFIWPNEIGGTYDFIKHHKDLIDKWSININMDMVGEGLRQNNGVFTMSECPNHLPSYLDGLTASIMNYVWRTNDIVYLPDSPRGRRGGQYFPKPMVEKNGSLDAFRFSYHRATGGSDHICFNNPSVGVPGIELNIWPDQWYHADTDTPDKSDPTQMKRVAFIGAASAWTAANCTDEVLEGLLDAVSAFGYRRIADRELPKAIRIMETAHTDSLDMAMGRALDFVNKAVERESDVIQSTREIYSNSEFARSKVDLKVQQWKLYKDALQTQVKSYGVALARAKGSRTPRPPGRSKLEKQMDLRIPMIHPDVFGQEFYPERTQRFIEIMKTNPEEFQKIPLNRYQTRSVMNFVNGERSVSEIWKWAQVDTESDIDLEGVGQLLDFLESLDWIQYR